MRIWSIHPKYLDVKGLVALWRETLLAKNVLEGKTKGYKNHPQLIRFKNSPDADISINYYLKIVWEEAVRRNYNFDKTKFIDYNNAPKLDVTIGQLNFERKHLLSKLEIRDTDRFNSFSKEVLTDIHPIFNLVDGEIEPWEKI